MGSSGIKLGPPGHPISFLFLFWPCHAACGILVPRPGIEPGPSEVRMWHCPNSGPPRNSPGYPISNKKLNTYPHHKYTSHNLTIFLLLSLFLLIFYYYYTHVLLFDCAPQISEDLFILCTFLFVFQIGRPLLRHLQTY